MEIRVILIGKTVKGFLEEGESEYLKRLKHYSRINRIVIPDLKNRKNKSIDQIKAEEGEKIIKACEGSHQVILLDEKGKQRTSEHFAHWLQGVMNQGGKDITFVIGGAYGFSEEVYKMATAKISLSDMTFSHQMIRMLFFEQIYRAFTILKGEPYHHK